ncbi:hypothetical protein AHMF7605_20690 [Adhaeribacter arboris]|uniref:STAS/SEC14 domain-containing protein n=1 Tax=Adhaeribacter arboris TaxID=2072846 RepID=A0A2T2YJR1_9BACT|nr:hypothetical protein [Adhaeribacter arboris]PSR55748.1 hypothetical protein AHMF7605_20690 [Adhaeribacter arboris]
MIVFEKNNIELELHLELKILEIRWIGGMNEEDLKVLFYKTVETANKYAVESILLDATYVETGKSAAVYDTRLQPLFQQKIMLPTVKRIARVSSGNSSYDEAFNQHYATLMKSNPAAFEFRNFNHHYEAMDWLTAK